jgi:hypothetical protein
MATEVNARGADVKIRHPWGGFFLVLITFGIYYLFWYFFINRELRDFGRASADADGNRIEVNPWISLLAVSLGAFLLVPPFVSMYRTFKRIRAAQEIADVGPKASPGIGLLLFFIAVIFFPVEVPYAQTNLNRVWRAYSRT